MSTASLVAHQARYDLRVFLRDPRARGFTLALPLLLLLLLFGYIFKHEVFTYNGVSIPGVSYYLPRMIVLGIASVTLSNLVVVLVAKRDIAQVLPIRPLAVAMQAAFDPRTNGGRRFAWPDLLIVIAWGVAGALFAVRRFSWSPSQA